MFIPAHASHWAVSLIYFAPVLVIIAAIGITSWRDRRADVQADAQTAGSRRAGAAMTETEDSVE